MLCLLAATKTLLKRNKKNYIIGICIILICYYDANFIILMTLFPVIYDTLLKTYFIQIKKSRRLVIGISPHEFQDLHIILIIHRLDLKL